MQSLLENLLESLENDLGRIEACLSKLTQEAIWTRPREGVNSIGNLCLHLAGNESHYLGVGLGNSGYERDRPGEFEADGGVDQELLLAGLKTARQGTRTILEGLKEGDLDRVAEVNYPPNPTFIRVLIHVVTHYAYHTGQIILQTRILQAKNENLLGWKH